MLGGINNTKGILSLIDQEKVFEFLGFDVSYNRYVFNPLRADKTPGCSFIWVNGVLFFADFTRPFPGYRASISCTEAYELIHKKKLDTSDEFKNGFYSLSEEKSEEINQRALAEKLTSNGSNRKITIKFKIKPWETKNYMFDIPQRLLHYEGVFLVREYACNTRLNSTMVLNRFNNPQTELTIIYYFFEDNSIKMYFPDNKYHMKFWGNSTNNNIYGLRTLKKTDNKLWITKSGADFLCLKYVLNQNVIALNSEWPSLLPHILFKIKKFNYDEIIILFDNDQTGMNNSVKLKDYLINQGLEGRIRCEYLPSQVLGMNCKDPKDLYRISIPILKKTIKELYYK